MNDLKRKFEELKRFNATLETSSDKDITLDTLELFNDLRKGLGINGGASIGEPIRNYDNFNLHGNGNLIFKYKSKVK